MPYKVTAWLGLSNTGAAARAVFQSNPFISLEESFMKYVCIKRRYGWAICHHEGLFIFLNKIAFYNYKYPTLYYNGFEYNMTQIAVYTMIWNTMQLYLALLWFKDAPRWIYEPSTKLLMIWRFWLWSLYVYVCLRSTLKAQDYWFKKAYKVRFRSQRIGTHLLWIMLRIVILFPEPDV